MKKYGELDVNKYDEMLDSSFNKGLRVLKREGLNAFIERFYHYCGRRVLAVASPFVINFAPKKFFKYKEKEFPYFKHKKSLTWTNERAIEIPIAKKYVDDYSGKKILEVGAVLPHYFPKIDKDTIDKFEKGEGIINEDVTTFKPSKKYDLIVSISTLEHVGFDDDVKDSEGTLKAINNLRDSCLNDGGKLVVTLPIGYNKWSDESLFSGKLGFQEMVAYKREKKNIWKEVPFQEIKDCKYNNRCLATVICIYDKPSTPS
jgi:hypothetical protein